MATIYIDDEAYTVEISEKNLLQACLSLGLNLPYFCWHPALRSVGACRQCAVKLYKDTTDTHGKIVMACMTAIKDGMRVSLHDPEVVEFRAGVIEWLMVNHPHDCPVCDEGGECHLQDMTVMTGHVYRRYRFRKRSYRNQDLGPFVDHEMNRCIQCYRCVRFYRDYAGGCDLDVLGWHDHVYFGRYADGVLENPFSGNLVEICPTGVFTDKTQHRHYTRKWDLQNAPSLCVHCGVGCNTTPGERYGTLRRIRNRFQAEVNGYFICDKGRYGYEFVNDPQRFRQALLRDVQGELKPVSRDEALTHLTPYLQQGRVLGIGSPRASLEANYALKSLVGSEHFYSGFSARQYELLNLQIALMRNSGLRSASIIELESADAVVILGEDIQNTAPRLALAVRQAITHSPELALTDLNIPNYDDYAFREAVQEAYAPLIIATPAALEFDREATFVSHTAPDDIARLGFALAHEIDPDAPVVADITAQLQEEVEQLARVLRSKKKPAIISGLGCNNTEVIHAAAQLTLALQHAGVQPMLTYAVSQANDIGLTLLGGRQITEALAKVNAGEVDTVIVLENDLSRLLDAPSFQSFCKAVPHLIMLEMLPNATTNCAEVVLPAAAFAEATGTLVNYEGRLQRYFQVFPAEGDIQASWRWLCNLQASRNGQELPLQYASLLAALAADYPAFAQIGAVAPSVDFRLVGQKIPRKPQRYSGRTAMNADVDVFEPASPLDPNSPLAFSMEGYQGQSPAELTSNFWAPGWNSIQALNKFQQEVGGPLRDSTPAIYAISPQEEATLSYSSTIPPSFVRRNKEWLLLPAQHIFGSEALSMYTAGIRELAPSPYLGLNIADMQRLNVQEGQRISLIVERQVLKLPVKTVDSLQAGTALLPVGLPEMAFVSLPTWGLLLQTEAAGGKQ